MCMDKRLAEFCFPVFAVFKTRILCTNSFLNFIYTYKTNHDGKKEKQIRVPKKREK